MNAAAALSKKRLDRGLIEASATMRSTQRLGALAPHEPGGPGQTVSQLPAACHKIGEVCASAMVLAMHHIQPACLFRPAKAGAWPE